MAAIPSEVRPTPLPTIQSGIALTNQGGTPSIEGLQSLGRVRDYVNGAGRLIPCSAAGTNIVTLTPNDASPSLEGYMFGDVFVFWAENNSTGAVTMTVVPKTGSLSTLKAYKTNGSAQAGNGDVVSGLLYFATYHPLLDASAGGFVLK